MDESGLALADLDRLNRKLSELLDRTALALCGPPDPGRLYDWGDLPDAVLRLRTERDMLHAQVERLLADRRKWERRDAARRDAAARPGAARSRGGLPGGEQPAVRGDRDRLPPGSSLDPYLRRGSGSGRDPGSGRGGHRTGQAPGP